MGSTFITQHEDGRLERTAEGEEYLASLVTNTKGDIYSFYDAMEPRVVAAALARLSQFGGDLRELLLKEFAGQSGEQAALLRRVLTQFGDDAVAQLSYVPVMVENASHLLSKQLEWGRLAAYLEQSTRNIFYDQKRNGQYRYYTPQQLPKTLRDEYIRTMDAIFDNYTALVRQMTEWLQSKDGTPEAERDVAWRIAVQHKARQIARGLLPIATTATVGIVGSAQAIDTLITHLLAEDVSEAKEAGAHILEEVRKQHAFFFERTDMPEAGMATVAYKHRVKQHIEAVAAKVQLAKPKPAQIGATLLDYSPQDELALVTHMLFARTNLSFAELEQRLAAWSEDELAAALALYMGERTNRHHKPGRALEVARYTFEIVSDYDAFRELHRHRLVDAIEWQKLTPYLGYTIPSSIKEAGLEELYTKTHALATALYEKLVSQGFSLEAQYATLLDARMRWKVTLNARAAFNLIESRTEPQDTASYRSIAQAMHAEIAKVHPRLAKAMLFVGRKADDPVIDQQTQLQQAAAQLKALGIEI